MKPPTPPRVGDADRLAALDSYSILDTPPEQGFDDVVHLACQICATPVALVSLVAGDRQWFKARVNFPPCETDLDRSVCAFTLGEPDVLVIPDLAADPRTSANPLVTDEPFIRFYAGAPLRMDDGHVLGSLCVIDHVPRPGGLAKEQAEGLTRLARSVVTLIGLRKAVTTRDIVLARQDVELRRDRRLELLSDASAVLLTASDPANALLSMLEAEALSLGFEQSYAYALSADRRHLSLTHAVGADPATRDLLRNVPVDVPLAGIVAETGQPVILKDLQRSDDPRHDIARSTGAQAFAGYPITSHGRVAGVISYMTSGSPAFDPEALSFFASIARLLSLAQERLDDEEARRLSEERLSLALGASGLIGWFDWDVPLDRLCSGASFARMYGVDPAAAAVGVPITAFLRGIHPDDREGIGAEIARAMSDRSDYDAEYRLLATDGTVTWAHALGRVGYDDEGRPSRFSGVVSDVTAARVASRRQDALLALGDRLRDLTTKGEIAAAAAETVGPMLGLSRAGYCTVDAERETVEVERDWALPGLPSIAGPHHFRTYGSYIDQLKRGQAVVVRDVRTDPRTAGTADSLIAVHSQALFNLPIMERGRFVGLLFALCGRPRAWTDDELRFLREIGDRTRAAIARAEAEDQQRLLNGELAHRLKNTLAIVQSIAAQGLRGVTEQDLVKAFDRRVLALSRAHDALVQRNWSRARLRAVLEGVLTMQVDLGRFHFDGPDMDVSADAAMSLSLLAHELATNALKYGALSVVGGSVRVAWRPEEAAEPMLALEWAESGGPPALAPSGRTGFGSKLIRMGLLGTREADIRYERGGLRAAFRAPLARVQA